MPDDDATRGPEGADATPETLSHAVDRLTARGYEEDLRAEDGGLRTASSGELLVPEELVVDEIVRFEGTTDPADQALLLALRCPRTGARGTYTTAYGPDVSPADADISARLRPAIQRYEQDL